MRLGGAVFFSVSGRDDWAAEAAPGREVAPSLMPGLEHVMEYHALARGVCWASMPGGPEVRLAAGDVVVFHHGHAHVISNAPGIRGETGVNWLANAHAYERPYQASFDGRQVELHALPDKPNDTAIVCGFLGCDLQPFNPLIAALPPLLHLRASEDDAWIASFKQQAVAESDVRRPSRRAFTQPRSLARIRTGRYRQMAMQSSKRCSLEPRRLAVLPQHSPGRGVPAAHRAFDRRRIFAGCSVGG